MMGGLNGWSELVVDPSHMDIEKNIALIFRHAEIPYYELKNMRTVNSQQLCETPLHETTWESFYAKGIKSAMSESKSFECGLCLEPLLSFALL